MASPIQIHAFSLRDSGWIGYEAASRKPGKPTEFQDLDNDGRVECVTLTGGRLAIRRCGDLSGQVLWQSPSEWQVKGWTFSDLNHDTAVEVTLLVWRRFTPWPIDNNLPDGASRISGFHDAKGDSCHVILIGWRKGNFDELWAGSALYEPVLSLAAADINADGAQELLTVEGRYQDPGFLRSGPLAVWKWNGFGFDLYQRFAGKFRQVVVSTSSPGWMIVSQ